MTLVRLLGLLLFAGALSYFRQPVITLRGLGGVALDRGRLYFVGPALIVNQTRAGVAQRSDVDVEAALGQSPHWWKPIRRLARLPMWVVEGWLPAATLLVTAVLLWRRGRRGREEARGFEVRPGEDAGG